MGNFHKLPEPQLSHLLKEISTVASTKYSINTAVTDNFFPG